MLLQLIKLKKGMFGMLKGISVKYKVWLPIGLLLLLLYMVESNLAATNEEIVEGLSDSLIRFHVLANSDSEEDQALKLKVKDKIVETMAELLEESGSKAESKQIIMNNFPRLKTIAEGVMEKEGYDYDIALALKDTDFPIKRYGDIILPAGEYEALVITIGEGKGKNWWCVLFPPLCFVDATHNVVDDDTKQAFKDVLTEEEYDAILLNNPQNVDVKVRFKIVDWLSAKEKELDKTPTIVYDMP